MKHILLCTFLLCLWSGEAGVAQDKTKDKKKPHPLWVTEKPITKLAIPYFPTSISFSPDEKHLAISFDNGHRGGWVLLGNPQGNNFKKVAVQKMGLSCVAFSPDGKTIATSCTNGYVTRFNLRDEKELWKVQVVSKTNGYNSCLEFSPDGRLLAVGAGDDGRVRLSRACDGKLLRVLEGSLGHTVWAIAFSPDGRFVAAGEESRGKAYVWNVKTGTRVAVLQNKPNPTPWNAWWVRSLKFSVDGRMLATVGPGGKTWVWERWTGKVRHKFSGDPLLKGGGSFERFGNFACDRSLLSISPSGKLFASLTRGKQPHKKGPIPCTLHIFRRRKLSVPQKQRVLDGSPKSTLQNLIAKITSRDASVAYQAILKLSGCQKAVTQLTPKIQKLRTEIETRTKAIPRLVGDLDSSRYRTRIRAEMELRLAAWTDAIAIRKHLKGDLARETRTRLEKVLKEFRKEPMPEDLLFLYRAIEVLELVGTKEAQSELNKIAKCGSHGLATEASEALVRMNGE